MMGIYLEKKKEEVWRTPCPRCGGQNTVFQEMGDVTPHDEEGKGGFWAMATYEEIHYCYNCAKTFINKKPGLL